VIQTLLFVSGLSTFLQSLFGTRLPIVVVGSYSYIIPIISIVQARRYNSYTDPLEVNYETFLCFSYFYMLQLENVSLFSVCLIFLEVYYDNERDSRCFDHKLKFSNGYWIFRFLEECCKVSSTNKFRIRYLYNTLICNLILYVYCFIHRFLSPLSVVPYVTFAGLGLYQLGFPMVTN
jgi:nucleobase transporter 1/2